VKPCSPCKTELTDREREVLNLIWPRLKENGQLSVDARNEVAELSGYKVSSIHKMTTTLRAGGYLPPSPVGYIDRPKITPPGPDPSEAEQREYARRAAVIRAGHDPRPYQPEPPADTGRWVRAWKKGKAAQEYLHAIRRRYPTRLHEHDEPRAYRVVGGEQVRRIVEARELAARRPWTWGVGGRAS
jgi:hypothetical protein